MMDLDPLSVIVAVLLCLGLIVLVPIFTISAYNALFRRPLCTVKEGKRMCQIEREALIRSWPRPKQPIPVNRETWCAVMWLLLILAACCKE